MNENQRAADPVPIPLDRLIPNADYQPRGGGLSESHVRLLMESDPAGWTPLLVSPADDGRYDVIDGFHRLEAAGRLGLTTLACAVAPGAGYPEAVAANLAHGLPLGMTDRKDAARWHAENAPGLSYREIGRRCGLSDKTAKRAVEEGPGAESPQSGPDPIRSLVRAAYRAYSDGAARSLFGFGKGASPAAFRRRIEEYDDDDRPKVAAALAAFGRAIVAAADTYLPKKGA